ncbi:MAG: lipopolysaccharide biosynthesis protein [Solirubrobacterales bacterium]
MNGYLRRLATTGAAYTASSVLSKLFAVAFLPLYTRHVSPEGFGAAEVLTVAAVAAAITIRLGLIEAVMRFYYAERERPEDIVRTGFAAMLLLSVVGVAALMPFAGPISRALLDTSEPGLARIAIAGVGVFVLYDYMLTLYRLDERAKAYFAFTIANVLITIPVTVWLVVVKDEAARGLLIGQFGVGAVILAGLIVVQRRRLGLVPDPALLRRMARFGLPMMPAELSLYSLSFIDRILIVHLIGLGKAGLYALAVKFAQGVQVLVRGFQLAYPPLAYSIADDEEARQAYADIVSWFLAACTFVVVGMWLFSRWIVRFLAAPEFFGAHEAVGLISTGVMLYALYFVMVVIIGRTNRTELSFPATVAGTAANIGLNLALVPPLGIVGAGLALVASYLVILAVMYVLTQRLFPVPYQWRRIGQVALIAAAVTVPGEMLLPDEGLGGLVMRGLVWLAFPLLLWVTRFPSLGERVALARNLRPSMLRERLRSLRASPIPAGAGAGGGAVPEALEVEIRDEDRL